MAAFAYVAGSKLRRSDPRPRREARNGQDGQPDRPPFRVLPTAGASEDAWQTWAKATLAQFEKLSSDTKLYRRKLKQRAKHLEASQQANRLYKAQLEELEAQVEQLKAQVEQSGQQVSIANILRGLRSLVQARFARNKNQV